MKLFGSESAGKIIKESCGSKPSNGSGLHHTVLTVIGLMLGALSSVTWGLGLGELQSKSYLGQPLNAEIELLSLDGSVDLTTLIVRQVTVTEALAMGIDVSYTPYHLKLDLDKSSGVPKVTIISNESIKEPYLNLLIELRWATGVVYREYPLLLDPVPTVSIATLTPKPEAPVNKFVPILSVKTSDAQVEADPSALPPKRKSKKNKKYVVQQGDTLSKIAQHWRRTSGQNSADIMKWLHENNPDAFARGNINQLRQGAVLQMPGLAGDTEDVDAEESTSSEATIPTLNISITDKGVEGSLAPSTDAAGKAKELLKQSELPTSSTEKAGGLLTVSETTKDDKTREMIDLLVRDNETLRERVEKLEKSEYLDTLKQLIILQRQQISELRKKLGDEDASASVEMDSLLTQIGVDPKETKASPPANKTAPVANSEKESLPPTAAQNSQASEPALLNIKRDATSLIASAIAHKRDWALWIMVGFGIFLIGLFVALFKYYRTLVPVKNVEAEYEEILESMDEGDGKGRVYYDSSSLDEPGNFVLYDGESEPAFAYDQQQKQEPEPTSEFVTAVESKPATPTAKGDNWLGESADTIKLEDEFDFVMEDVQRSFERGSADQSPLVGLDKLSDTSLEGLTSEMPNGVVRSNKDSSGGDSRAKNERRPDDVVRLSIAEKMSQYNPEEYRNELENLGFLELDELVDSGETEEDEDEVEAIIYRAKMFCEFKKYDKAIELIALKIDVIKDQRLSDALDEVCALRDKNTNTKKVS